MNEQGTIKVEVCCGTTCYLLGAQVEIVAMPCLEVCTNDNYSHAPFVRINGEILGEATVDLISRKVNELLERPVR